MITTHSCPNCGANVRDDGFSDSVRCTFCETQVVLPRARRRSLEEERDTLLRRRSEWDARLEQSNARGIQDFMFAPLGCCGIYVALFLTGSMILGALGLRESKDHGTIVAAVAITSALLGAVLILWRGEKRRRERIVALEAERDIERELLDVRIRGIEAELQEIGG